MPIRVESSRYLCTKAISRGGASFALGELYYTRLPQGNNTMSIDKEGGGVAQFSTAEFKRHFIPVLKMKCSHNLMLGGRTFTRGTTYLIRKDVEEHFIIIADQQHPMKGGVTISLTMLEKHFMAIT